MNEFQQVLRTVLVLCLTCAALAVLVAALDAFHPFPLADYLVRKFGDTLTLCVGAIVGFLAGHHHGIRKGRNQKSLRDDSLVR
jgi:hypothetical protein